MNLSPGTRLGAYEILSLLGVGGMGEVYRARDTKLGRDVAIKVLPEAFAADPERVARFEREARAIAALSHPNILAIFDFGSEGRAVYAVTELLVGATLRDKVGAVTLRKSIGYAIQIARGLAAAHARGIAHRDLKPENLFVKTDGQLKILDFGLARHIPVGDDTTTPPTPDRFTDPGTVLGTVGYMSPEQVRGEPGDARSDIFSFGAVLYELVSGHRAFQRPTAVETMTAILKDDPPPLTLKAGDRTLSVPALARVIQHCLEKNPVERFQHASDVAFALEALCETPPAPGLEMTSTGMRRRFVVWGLAGVLAVGGVVGWIWRSSPRTDPTLVRPQTADGTSAAEGADAFARGKLYDTLERIEQAISSYESAVRLLPDGNPNRQFARTRLEELRAQRSELANVLRSR